MSDQETPIEFLLYMREPLDEGNDGLGVNDLDDATADHPVEKFFKRAQDDQIVRGSGDWNWDAPISTRAPLEKREAQIENLDFSDIYADAKLYAKRMKQEWGVEAA